MTYNFTPSLRGVATVNTDFAETEVDQRLVNLTRFPLFLPERRTFFLDGATFFDFANRAFFSRRIGLDARGQPQRIDIGSKVTGQAGRQDVGALYVRTGEDEGALGEDFLVLRARRRMLQQSYVGALYTGRATRGPRRARRAPHPRARRPPGHPLLPRATRTSRRSAYLLHASTRGGTGQNMSFGSGYVELPQRHLGGRRRVQRGARSSSTRPSASRRDAASATRFRFSSTCGGRWCGTRASAATAWASAPTSSPT